MKATHNMFSAWQEVTSGERNEVVFEHLNKTYGAYQIRANYNRTLLKVFSATGIIVILISAMVLLMKSDPVIVMKFPKDDMDVFNPKKLLEDTFVPKTPELPKTTFTPKTSQTLVPEVTTEPEKRDDQNILPIAPNNNLNGTPCDSCQDNPEIISGLTKNTGPIIGDDNEVREISGIDILPHFPGGDAELYRFLSSNAHIPEQIKEIGNIKERVGVVFIIDKDGSVTDIALKHGSKYDALNTEALRVVKKMPKWEPGRQNGKPVKVRLIIPLLFEVL
ncbi:MAG: energy transducer TonB [Bacteroidetes bacterium]|nr:MAG: energy transducer TonB [Bacteroidota bacterium]